MRERRVCARAVGAMSMMRKTMRRAEGELRGCFAKQRARRFRFVVAVLPIRTREKRDFQKKSTKKSDFEMLVSSLC